MRLIGMLDSPYVRRVAISLKLQHIPFEHEPLSVFSSFDAFAAINPVVKAPSLVTDAGVVLMDSGLILEYAERLAAPEFTLSPAAIDDHARAQRIIGLALAACEKTVQIVYEQKLRPSEKQHQPWLDRVEGQLSAAYKLLEDALQEGKLWLFGTRPLQADISAAVAYRFTNEKLPGILNTAAYTKLAKLSAQAETTEAFRAYPYA